VVIDAAAPIGSPAVAPARLAPQYAVIYTLSYPARQSRWKVAARLILALPELLAVVLVYWLLYPLALASWLIIVFSGRLDRTLWGFSVAILRWIAAVLSYATLLRDEYPGFGRRYPLRFEIVFPERRSRVRTLFRAVLILPQLVVVELLFTPLLIGALVAWFAMLIDGQYPEGIWRLVAGLNRWILRVAAYGLLLRDDYPPYTLGLWEPAAVAALATASARGATEAEPATASPSANAADAAEAAAPEFGGVMGLPIGPSDRGPAATASESTAVSEKPALEWSPAEPPAPDEAALFERPWPAPGEPPAERPAAETESDQG